MKTTAALFTLPAAILALPSSNEARGLLGQLGNAANDLSGLLGSVASSVDPANYRPEPGYEFQHPKSTDSRGPCPGLNLLANHGYLPRDGHVNYGQIVEAVARGFNMGADLATVLAVFAILADGDIETESWYLGAGLNNVGGLNRHSTVEVDISPNREDYYLACGDNHHLSSSRFKQNVMFANESPKEDAFGYDTMRKHYGANSRFSQEYNPWLYYFPFPSIVSVVAFNFYSEYFSNGTYGAVGVANYESISSIIGAQRQSNGEYKYVPERWPEQGWYRRDREYGAVEALTDGFTRIYPANPVAMPVAEIGTPNLNITTLICNLYQGLNSITPLSLSGDVETTEAGITWALGKLAAVGLSGTVLGCPTNAISSNPLYGNATTAGGPLGPSLKQAKNAGNNVYDKVYWTEMPEQQTC